jgi:hypothetical protein
MRYVTCSLYAFGASLLVPFTSGSAIPTADRPEKRQTGCQAQVGLGIGYAQSSIVEVEIYWASITRLSDWTQIGGAQSVYHDIFNSGSGMWSGWGLDSELPWVLVMSWNEEVNAVHFDYADLHWDAVQCSLNNKVPANGGTCLQITTPDNPNDGFYQQQVAVDFSC